MRIAIVQKAAIHNDIDASIYLANQILAQAKKKDAELVIFGECWMCGYPAWIDYSQDVGLWDHGPVKAAWANIYQNSLATGSEKMSNLQSIILDHGIPVIMGANEVIKTGAGNGSIFNACYTFGKDGTILNHHRKLMPTHTERLIHAQGDAHGIESVLIDGWRIGALICWEHWMPLTRQAMHDAAEDIHVALWPMVKEMNIVASRQYAFEGKCYVVSVGTILPRSATPTGLQIHPSYQSDDPNVLRGGSCIIGPDGTILLEPQYDLDDIIYFELPDQQKRIGEHMNLSVSGHYQRPDVFSLDVNKKRIF